MNAYGKKAFRFSKNNIKVTIPFDRLAEEDNVPVRGENAPVDAQVSDENTPVTTPVSDENTPVTTLVKIVVNVPQRILEFCTEPRSILEIAKYLGYKEKKTVRKYLIPLLEQGRIAMTVPDKPNSRLQKYITIQ